MILYGFHMILHGFIWKRHLATPPRPHPLARRQWPSCTHNAPWSTTAGPVHAHRTCMGGHKVGANQRPFTKFGRPHLRIVVTPLHMRRRHFGRTNYSSHPWVIPPHWVNYAQPRMRAACLIGMPGKMVPPANWQDAAYISYPA